MLDENIVRLVIDNGSHMCKAGFVGDDAPRSVFPTIVGKSEGGKDPYVGDEGRNSPRGFITPIKHGIITDWDGMEKIWFHTLYNELRIVPKDHAVLLTEPTLNPNATREKTVEVMFETFEVPATYLAGQAVLALYASGMTTGFVLDCGNEVSHAVPTYEGYALTHGVKTIDLSGQNITDRLRDLLNERYHSFYTTAEREIVNDIKEKLGYVAVDYNEELKKSSNNSIFDFEKNFTLPDGKVINVGNEAFKCTEIMFDPSVLGNEYCGISRLSHESIMSCSVCVRKDLYANIVLSGGTTLFSGFAERLRKEVSGMTSPDFKMRIHDSAERKYLTWIGGSILASLDTFREMWITKEQYRESGPQIVHKSCPV